MQEVSSQGAQLLHQRGARVLISLTHALQVCALWHPELQVRPGGACNAVEGLRSIRTERRGVQCSLCGSRRGAIVRCSNNHCYTAFHPLCARNNALHMSVSPTAVPQEAMSCSVCCSGLSKAAWIAAEP